jgi:hypothetical protein
MAKTTPYSQIAGIFIFASLAPFTNSSLTLVLQGVFIAAAVFMFRLRLGKLRPRQFIHLVPLVLFVLVLNALQGGGEIVLRSGPVMVTRQGIFRGIFLSTYILELFLMSRLLAEAHEKNTILNALQTMEGRMRRMVKLRTAGSGNRRGYVDRDRHGDRGGYLVLLYYVLMLFGNTYGELRLVFRSGAGPGGPGRPGRKNKESLRIRVLRFFRSVFYRSLREYDEGRWELPESAGPLKPVGADWLFIAGQAAVVAIPFILRKLPVLQEMPVWL